MVVYHCGNKYNERRLNNLMKEIVKSIIILAVIYLLLFFLVNTNRTCQVIQEKQSQPVILTDTIVNVVYDTVYLERYKTVKLPIHDTINQTIIRDSLRIDSVFVDIPISKFQLDTTFTTDTTVFNLSIRNSGYDVKLDSLSYSFTYKPTKTKKTHWFIGPSLGIGYNFTTRKLVPTIGIGLIIKIF